MIRVEMKESKKKQIRGSLIILSVCLLSFLFGFFTNWCICKSIHYEVPKIDVSGNPPHYVVDTPEILDDSESVPTEEPEEEFISYYDYTEEELDLLSRLIYAESGAESYETKLKVGSVVMNRVSDRDSKDFPDTIREVIYQKNQFLVTTIKIDGVPMIDRPADEESKRVAKEILDYGSVLPIDVQVFYAEGKCDGNWVTTREVYDVCDGTVFAYIHPKKGY